MRIFLARHGHSDGNANRDNYAVVGDSLLDITDKGWEQTIALGTFFADYIARTGGAGDKPPRLWVAPHNRTRQSAAGVIHGAKGLFTEAPRIAPAAAEQSYGLYSYLQSRAMQDAHDAVVAEFTKISRGREEYFTAFPQGESPFDVQMRNKELTATIMRDAQHGIKDVFCMMHGVSVRTFAMDFMHIDPLRYAEFSNPENASLYLIEGDRDQGYSLKQIWNGEEMKEVPIDWGKKLKAGEMILPPVPKKFMQP